MIITTSDANTWKPLHLRLAPGDIEEAFARCGWTILNTAEEVSEEDTAEVARIEAQGFAGMTPRNSIDALAWWNARIITEG